MTFMDLIVPVMLVAGALGGLVNRFLLNPAEEKPLTALQHILVGVAAAFIVPVMLNMISSTLIKEVKGGLDQSDGLNNLLILAGFCLLAAISARAFIHSLSDRLIRLVNEANKNANEAKAVAVKAETIAELAAEPAEEAVSQLEVPGLAPAELTEAEARVLEAMITSRYTMRTAIGLARDTKLPRPEVNDILDKLAAQSLIRSATGKHGQTLWYPTAPTKLAFENSVDS